MISKDPFNYKILSFVQSIMKWCFECRIPRVYRYAPLTWYLADTKFLDILCFLFFFSLTKL